MPSRYQSSTFDIFGLWRRSRDIIQSDNSFRKPPYCPRFFLGLKLAGKQKSALNNIPSSLAMKYPRFIILFTDIKYEIIFKKGLALADLTSRHLGPPSPEHKIR